MAVDFYAAMTVTVPVDEQDGRSVRCFTVEEAGSRWSFITGRGRGTPPGTYTGLYRGNQLWMSDTPDEKLDLMPCLRAVVQERAERVLVNGLGLGMVVSALFAIESVRHVDAVEIDPAVVALVGPHYEQMARETGRTFAVHCADAYTVKWPAGTRWDCIWHDIWRDICSDNLKGMEKLHRRYGNRCKWQGSWGRYECLRAKRMWP